MLDIPTIFATPTDYTGVWSPLLAEPHWLKVENTICLLNGGVQTRTLGKTKIVKASIFSDIFPSAI